MSSAPRTPGARTPARRIQPTNPPSPAGQPCQHPRVQIVAREQDSEFVECLECREVFEASEFRDMDIEEKIQGSEPE